jgi:hypothetical protein
MKNLGINKSKCAPILEYREVVAAYHQRDILLWLLVNGTLAGYMWRKKQAEVIATLFASCGS